MEKEVQVRLKYCGKLDGIDASVLLPSLLGFVELVQEVNREVNPDAEIEVIIKSTGSGSFLVDLNLSLDVLQKIASLFSNHFSVEEVIEVTVGLLLLKKFLSGKAPEKVEERDGKVVIYINNSKLLVSEKVYVISQNNAKVDKAIAKMVEPVEEDFKIDGLEIEKEGEKVLQIDREEFSLLTDVNPLLSKETRVVTFEKQVLYPVKVVFAPGRKWEFVWNGEKISAYIKDEKFLNGVLNGKYSFREGTKIIADLEVEQIFDREIRNFLNKRYYVVNVQKVLNTQETPKLF